MQPTARYCWLALLCTPLALLPLAAGGTWPAVVVAWCVALALGVVDAAALLALQVGVQVKAPGAVGVGDPVPVQARLKNNARLPLRATLRPEVSAPLEPGEDEKIRLRGPEAALQLQANAPRRGQGGIQALWLRVAGPLGMVERVERVDVNAEVSVLPNLARARDLLVHFFGNVRSSAGLQVRLRGEAGELDALEAYVPGMDLRSVDWKASARHQALRVRRFRVERNQRLVVCVDTGRLMGDPIDGMQRLDHAVHAALSLSHAALRSGDLVAMHAYGDQPRAWLPPASGVRQMPRLMDAFSSLFVEPTETNSVLGLHDLLSRLKRRSLVVVFTEFIDSTTSELLVENLAQLAKRHLLIFVALDDPLVESPLSERPDTPGQLAAGVVAANLRRDRAQVLAKLERLGVQVIHAPPGAAALKLLERYVDIKRKGKIG